MNLKYVHFILSRPQLGENIGSVARAIKNFSIKNLRIVKPRCDWPNNKRATATAVGAKDVLKSSKTYDSLEESIGDLDLVFATTSRIRKVNKNVISIYDLKKKIVNKFGYNENDIKKWLRLCNSSIDLLDDKKIEDYCYINDNSTLYLLGRLL